jgi:hypothetical protein
LLLHKDYIIGLRIIVLPVLGNSCETMHFFN